MFDQKKKKLQESGLVDWPVFSELVAMDEDEEGFSKGLFQTFVDQFEETKSELDDNVQLNDLDKISALGHYLKGSAAALGLVTIAEQCERIQNYGNKKHTAEEDKDKNLNPDEYWIALVKDAVAKAEDAFKKLKRALNVYFGDIDESDADEAGAADGADGVKAE